MEHCVTRVANTHTPPPPLPLPPPQQARARGKHFGEHLASLRLFPSFFCVQHLSLCAVDSNSLCSSRVVFFHIARTVQAWQPLPHVLLRVCRGLPILILASTTSGNQFLACAVTTSWVNSLKKCSQKKTWEQWPCHDALCLISHVTNCLQPVAAMHQDHHLSPRQAPLLGFTWLPLWGSPMTC